jgi:hypothetical protein
LYFDDLIFGSPKIITITKQIIPKIIGTEIKNSRMFKSIVVTGTPGFLHPGDY